MNLLDVKMKSNGTDWKIIEIGPHSCWVLRKDNEKAWTSVTERRYHENSTPCLNLLDIGSCCGWREISENTSSRASWGRFCYWNKTISYLQSVGRSAEEMVELGIVKENIILSLSLGSKSAHRGRVYSQKKVVFLQHRGWVPFFLLRSSYFSLLAEPTSQEAKFLWL